MAEPALEALSRMIGERDEALREKERFKALAPVYLLAADASLKDEVNEIMRHILACPEKKGEDGCCACCRYIAGRVGAAWKERDEARALLVEAEAKGRREEREAIMADLWAAAKVYEAEDDARLCSIFEQRARRYAMGAHLTPRPDGAKETT